VGAQARASRRGSGGASAGAAQATARVWRWRHAGRAGGAGAQRTVLAAQEQRAAQARWSGPVARELRLGVVLHRASRVKELGWSGTEPARWPSGTRDLAAPRAPFPVGRW
jgi:hypothetical protein